MLNLDYFYYKIYWFFRDLFGFYFDGDEFFSNVFVLWIEAIAAFISVVFIIGIIYTVLFTARYRKNQLKDFAKLLVMPSPAERINRWTGISEHIGSNSPSLWRRAIIDADTVLDDILRRIGYPGNNLDERLAYVKPYQFRSLQKVLSAHRVKRMVEHESGMHVLTKELAENTIAQYKSAFEELEYI